MSTSCWFGNFWPDDCGRRRHAFQSRQTLASKRVCGFPPATTRGSGEKRKDTLEKRGQEKRGQTERYTGFQKRETNQHATADTFPEDLASVAPVSMRFPRGTLVRELRQARRCALAPRVRLPRDANTLIWTPEAPWNLKSG